MARQLLETRPDSTIFITDGDDGGEDGSNQPYSTDDGDDE